MSDICLYPPCKNAPKNRGLCATHLPQASKLVRNKLTTWTALINAGKAKAPKPQHGPVAAWFLSTEGLNKEAPNV